MHIFTEAFSSRYCLDDDFFLTCRNDVNEGLKSKKRINRTCGGDDESNATTPTLEKAGNHSTTDDCGSKIDGGNDDDGEDCLKGKKPIYNICNSMKYPLDRCDDCEAQDSCYEQFTAELLASSFSYETRGRGGFSLKMIFNPNGVSEVQYKPELFALKYSAIRCGRSDENYSENCFETDENTTNSTETVGDGECRGNNETTSTRNKGCFFPNALTDKCVALPCHLKSSRFIDTENGGASGLANGTDQPGNRTEELVDDDSWWEVFLSEKIMPVSAASLFLTILMYIFTPELQTNHSYFQINCFLSYLMSNVFVLVSVHATTVKPLCVFSAVMLHFSLLSAFSWMMLTSSFVLRSFHLLNRQISQALPSAASAAGMINLRLKVKYVASHVVGHGLPGVLVLGCVFGDLWMKPGIVAYGRGASFCWIHSEQSLMATFIVPSGLLLLINVCIFFGSCVCLMSFYARNRSSLISSTRNRWAFFVLVKLLIGSGIQWLFGILSHLYPRIGIFRFIFILLVSTHGIFLLFTTLLLKAVMRKIMVCVRSNAVFLINAVSH